MMTKSDLKTLRKKLPKDYRHKIAERTGFFSGYVYKVIAGERENESILDAAIALAAEYQAELESRKQAVKAL